MRAVILLPTYNEIDNILDILGRINKIRSTNKNFSLDVVVLDDNSPDGTGDAAKQFSKKNKWVTVVEGSKKGLGEAYMRGIRYCMNRSYDVLFEMDADLSHNPEYIPVFLAEIDKGYDVVIGSRYVKGGAIDGWNKIRKTISWLGNIFARNVAGIKLVQDCTSGFRAIRTDILHKAKFENLKSMGYSFQIEFLNRLIKAGAKVKEVPIVFKDRKRGRTKLGAADIVEFMADSIKIRLGR